MGQHCPGFPRVLYDALIHLGYDGDAPIYRCRLSRVHDLDRCEVSVMIPFDPARPWSGSVIDSEPDTGIEIMAHIALTSLCEDRLTATAALPITLLPGSGEPHMAATSCGRVRPQGPSLPHQDDFVGPVRAVPVQPAAQHRQDRHTTTYASNGVQGECHCSHWRDREAEARECHSSQRCTSTFRARPQAEGGLPSPW
jgi:hypothetical protein